ncbi:Rid family hydrolase [Trinickia violacea]|uniref:Rid family hydrolase n=1 Tax=Trinickia violacea TaxID=2571746 RepID=UPI001586C87C|nr:Rid family hydrolase [Trinickia violacea]
MTQTVEIPPKRQTRRHPTEWKRTIVALTFEPGASVARVARENNINANQVWAWRRLYAQGLLTDDVNPGAMLPVVVNESSPPSVQPPMAIEVPTATDIPSGSIQIEIPSKPATSCWCDTPLARIFWSDTMTDAAQFKLTSLKPAELAGTAGYAQAVEATGTRIIFVSGQTAINREGEIVGEDNFSAQVSQVFRNLDAALRAIGCDASNIAKMTVFLRDMGNLDPYRIARNAFFQSVTPAAEPAVTLIEVSRLYGSKFMIEIDAIAIA